MSGRVVKSVADLLGGPLVLWRQRPIGALVLILIAVVLALLNPVVGVCLWLSTPLLARLTSRLGRYSFIVAVAAFAVIYLLITFAVVPQLAQFSGRVPLPCRASDRLPLGPARLGYCLLGRNYIQSEAAGVVEALAREIGSKSGGITAYLDAGLPFGGLPLLPHLSHHDGRKLDVAFRYRSRATGLPAESSGSPIGYWVYEQPQPGEPRPCDGREGWLRWDLEWLQWLGDRHELDEAATRDVILAFADRPEVEKILLEPHLRERLRITSPKVRFQGCAAARHDDHFHVQFR